MPLVLEPGSYFLLWEGKMYAKHIRQLIAKLCYAIVLFSLLMSNLGSVSNARALESRCDTARI